MNGLITGGFGAIAMVLWGGLMVYLLWNIVIVGIFERIQDKTKGKGR